MNITSTEAEEALATIQKMEQKTRHAIAGSGATVTLITTGVVWLIGFVCTQFLPEISAFVWIGVSVLGSILGTLWGFRMGRRVRTSAFSATAKRAIIFWLLLVVYCVAVLAIAAPKDGKQVTMFIILFMMIGQLSMGLLISFSAVGWALPITALALLGYFFFPDIFYLWMGIVGGGGMIAFGLYIRFRW